MATNYWSWKLIDNSLEPIQALLSPAPGKFLNTIFTNLGTAVGKIVAIKVGLIS